MNAIHFRAPLTWHWLFGAPFSKLKSDFRKFERTAHCGVRIANPLSAKSALMSMGDGRASQIQVSIFVSRNGDRLNELSGLVAFLHPYRSSSISIPRKKCVWPGINWPEEQSQCAGRYGQTALPSAWPAMANNFVGQ